MGKKQKKPVILKQNLETIFEDDENYRESFTTLLRLFSSNKIAEIRGDEIPKEAQLISEYSNLFTEILSQPKISQVVSVIHKLIFTQDEIKESKNIYALLKALQKEIEPYSRSPHSQESLAIMETYTRNYEDKNLTPKPDPEVTETKTAKSQICAIL